MNIRSQFNCLVAEHNLLVAEFGGLLPFIVPSLVSSKRKLENFSDYENEEKINKLMNDAESLISRVQSGIAEEFMPSGVETETVLSNLKTRRNNMTRKVEPSASLDDEIHAYLEKVKVQYGLIKKSINGFKLLPAEIKGLVFRYLDLRAKRRFRAASAMSANDLASFPVRETYYAVGNPIDLTGSTLENLLGYVWNAGNKAYRGPFSTQTIFASLHGSDHVLRLFDNFDQANSYRHFHTPENYDEKLDYFYAVSTPAIFIVTLKNGYLLKEKKLQLREHWLESVAYPPKPQIETIRCFYTLDSNISKASFARFIVPCNYGFFAVGSAFNQGKNNSVDFSEHWDDGFNAQQKDMRHALNLAVKNLFARYAAPFYSGKTRHYQTEVKKILAFAGSNPEIDALFQFLVDARAGAADNQAVKPDGLYCRMLDFAISKLSEWKEANSLNGAESYFRITR